MNIESLSSANLRQVGTNASLQLNTRSNASSSVGGQPGATRPDISGAAKKMAELNDLKTSDPEKFKATLTAMAEKARTDAASRTGKEAGFLNGLADKLENAAQTGDLSQLKPGKPPAGMAPPGGRPPGGGGGAPGKVGKPAGGKPNAESSEETDPSVDPADKNGDGTVTLAEKIAYESAHPEKAVSEVSA